MCPLPIWNSSQPLTVQDLFEQNYKFSGGNFPLGINAKRPQCSQPSISKGFIFADATNFGSKMLGKIQESSKKQNFNLP